MEVNRVPPQSVSLQPHWFIARVARVQEVQYLYVKPPVTVTQYTSIDYPDLFNLERMCTCCGDNNIIVASYTDDTVSQRRVLVS